MFQIKIGALNLIQNGRQNTLYPPKWERMAWQQYKKRQIFKIITEN